MGACHRSETRGPPTGLDGFGVAHGTGFTQTPVTAGLYGFKAVYNGDGNYLPVSSLCEPLSVNALVAP